MLVELYYIICNGCDPFCSDSEKSETEDYLGLWHTVVLIITNLITKNKFTYYY